MSIVILDSFENENNIEIALKKLLKNKEDYSYFKLTNMNIKRCKGCGACGDKTPGKCVLKDDMELVLRDIAKSDWIIMLTPLRFGGYSSQLKLAVDRFMVLGLPLYYVKKGTLYHETRYERKNYFCIALAEQEISGQEENFYNIVNQNAANLSYTGKAIVFKASEKISKIEEEISNVFNGGDKHEQ